MSLMKVIIVTILELKNKIRDYPSTKWIIQFGRVQDGGEFIKRP